MSDRLAEIQQYQEAKAERRRLETELLAKLTWEHQRFRRTWADQWQDGTVVVRINGGLYVLKAEAREMLLAAARLIPDPAPQGDDE